MDIRRLRRNRWVDHDVWAVGEDLGIAGDNRISFCRSQIGETFTFLSETTADFRRSEKTGY